MFINNMVELQMVYTVRITHTFVMLLSSTLTHTTDGSIILAQNVERSSKFMERNLLANHVSKRRIIQKQGIAGI
jgi:hypothetical protein